MRLPRITTRRLCTIILVIGLTLGAIRLLHDGYYEERIRVLNELAQVDGIADVAVYGFDDITYEVASTRFQIVGRPGAVIEIQNPQEGLVGAPQHLLLQRLGPWEFHECSFGYVGVYETATGKPMESLSYTNCVDIGRLGEYAGMLPVKVNNVNDLVAHYDEIARRKSRS